MAEFMLFLWSDTSAPPDMSPAEIEAFVAEYTVWTEKLMADGRIVASQRLSDVRQDPARLLPGTGRDFAVTVLPLPETKEVVGGFYHIRARDYDEAVEIARTCPHLKGRGQRIEIREVRLG